MTLAWWFAAADADGTVCLPNGDGRIVRVGETLTVPGPVVLCERGLHASARAIDALGHAPGPIVCRVRLSGEIVHGDDKIAASERMVLAMADATRVLHIFAAGCALGALRDERDAGREPDPRSWAAVEAKIAWLEGRCSDENLDAAGSAAGSAAWAAAWAASLAAERDAARSAASAAMRDAARSAAGSAAGAAPWATSRGAAWDRQNRALESLLREALEATP